MSAEIQIKDQRKRQTAYFDIELDDAGLDPYAFRAYCRIARRAAGHDSGTCTESLENMADGCGMSRPSMVRALRTLIRRGMIQRVSRHGYTSVYALLDKAKWKDAEIAEQSEGSRRCLKVVPTDPPPSSHRSTPLVPIDPPVVLTDPPPGKPQIHKEDKVSTQKRKGDSPRTSLDPAEPVFSSLGCDPQVPDNKALDEIEATLTSLTGVFPTPKFRKTISESAVAIFQAGGTAAELNRFAAEFGKALELNFIAQKFLAWRAVQVRSRDGALQGENAPRRPVIVQRPEHFKYQRERKAN